MVRFASWVNLTVPRANFAGKDRSNSVLEHVVKWTTVPLPLQAVNRHGVMKIGVCNYSLGGSEISGPSRE